MQGLGLTMRGERGLCNVYEHHARGQLESADTWASFFFQQLYPDGREPLEVREKRVDPFVDQRYTLKELIETYRGEYSKADVTSYWKYAMKPNDYKFVD